MTDLATIKAIYAGSNGEATKALYADLEKLGPRGIVAVNLFRACKASERAKLYTRRYKGAAYDKKQWSMDNLCAALLAHQVGGIRFGWGIDEKAQASGSPHLHVLYVDTPEGQISYHTDRRGDGPDYPGQWDGVKDASAERACRFAASLLEQARGLMVAYSFKLQFAESIRAGLELASDPHIRPKRQTIRGNRKRHARPGEVLQLYRGMRTKHCFLIGRAWCTATWPILLDFTRERVEIRDNPTTARIYRPDALDEFARADGFEDWVQMRKFWRDTHDIKEFEGAIILWAARKDGRLAA